jgi:hypothetical protein
VISEVLADSPKPDPRPTFTIKVKSDYDKLEELGGPADLGVPHLKRHLPRCCKKYPLSRVGPILAGFAKDDIAVRHWPWAACAISLYATERQERTKYTAELSPKEVLGLIKDMGKAAQQLHSKLLQLHGLAHRKSDPTAPSHRGHLSWLDAVISQAAAGRISEEIDESGEALLSAYVGKGLLLKLLEDIRQATKIAAKGTDKKLLNRERPQSEPALPNFAFQCGRVWRSLTGRQPNANKLTRRTRCPALVRSRGDSVAKVENCRATNLSQKYEAGSNRRFVQPQSRYRSRL